MEMKIDGKICGMSFLSSHVHARQQTPNLFNLVLFQQLCGRDVCECLWTFLQAAWKQLETTYLLNEMFISNNVCMADFLHRFHWMISALEFDAPARCTSTE